MINPTTTEPAMKTETAAYLAAVTARIAKADAARASMDAAEALFATGKIPAADLDAARREWWDADAEIDAAPECMGHESTHGAAGISVYCNGACRGR